MGTRNPVCFGLGLWQMAGLLGGEMSKVTIIFEDGTSKEINKVSKVKMSNNGIGFCLPIARWVETYVLRHSLKEQKENNDLTIASENLPWEYWSIKFTPADATYDSWWNDYFTIEIGDKNAIVRDGSILDAFNKLIELNNES